MIKRVQEIPRQLAYVAAAMCLLPICDRSVLAQDDSFVQQRNAEATQNASAGFSISFADGRRTFHPGEAIKLVFTFRDYNVSPFNYEHTPGLGMADAVLDHSDGTADPLSDYWYNGILRHFWGILSGVRGASIGGGGKDGGDPPIEFAVYLNQSVRFDRPGKYRLYVRSRHRFAGGEGELAPPPLISNIVEFEIVQPDQAWEARTLQEALRIVDSSSDPVARIEAARSISYLGTSAAVDEMAQRVFRTPPYRDGPSDPDSALDYHWLRGLYGGRDRARVVARMERELDRAERYVSPWFVSHLALLDLTRRVNVRPIDRSTYESQLRSYSIRHLAALKAAGGLRKELEQTFALTADGELLLVFSGLASGFVAFPDDVEAAFAALSPIQQRTLLIAKRNWTVLRDPAFVPMLRRLTTGTDRKGPQDVALRLLYDMVPLEGRQIALRELAKQNSAVAISGFLVLPDAQLPRLEKVFIQSLERARTAEEYGQAIDRIERFATGRIFTRVRRAFERFKGARSCTLAPAALAYFFRVAPTYARTEIGNVMKEVYAGEPCETGVLPAVAERRVVQALEETAIAQLGDANGWVVADAALMLQQYGSPRAEGALWQALEHWHDRWKGQRAKLEQDLRSPDGESWAEAAEDRLTTALMRGTAWLMDESSARRLTSLCVTGDCKESVGQEFRYSPSRPRITVHASTLPRGEPTFSVTGNTFAWLLSREALHRWLALHTKETTFTWEEANWGGSDQGWLPGEAARLFEETRSFVESRGMTLIRRSSTGPVDPLPN